MALLEQLIFPGFDALPLSQHLPFIPLRRSSTAFFRQRLAKRARPSVGSLHSFLTLVRQCVSRKTIEVLRQRHCLAEQRLRTDRLHVTLLGLGDHAGSVPGVSIDSPRP